MKSSSARFSYRVFSSRSFAAIRFPISTHRADMASSVKPLLEIFTANRLLDRVQLDRVHLLIILRGTVSTKAKDLLASSLSPPTANFPSWRFGSHTAFLIQYFVTQRNAFSSRNIHAITSQRSTSQSSSVYSPSSLFIPAGITRAAHDLIACPQSKQSASLAIS